MPTLDTDSETGLLTSVGEPASYLSQLKSVLTPDQYAAVIKPLMYTANEKFGGKVQDYQAQLVTPLDIKKTGLPQQIKFTPSKIETYSDNEGGFYNVETGGVPILDNIQGVMESMGDSGDSLVGFRSIKPVDVNGVPVFANYDVSGKLTGYEGDPRTTSWINGKQRLIGKWDAEGLPDPQTSTSRGAGIKGFINDTFVNPLKENWVSIRDQLEAAAVVAGNYFVPGSSLLTSQLVTEGAQENLNTDVGRVANLTAGLAGAGAFDPAAAGPELLGEAGGNTFALEAGSEGVIPLGDAAASGAAAGGAVATPVYSPDLPVGTPLPPLTEPTLDEIIAELAPPATVVPPVEVGPELLGEAGGNTFPLDAPLEGEIPLGGTPTVSDITSTIDPNAVGGVTGPDNIDVGGGYNPATGATAAELAAARAAMVSKGLTFNEALNYVRGGLLVNALVGDPLGLSPDAAGGGGGGGATGFAIVPVPTEWKSPTYAAPAAPIDINSLFTDMNLLGGTQWQGLATQKPNISFNDIFASGQQRTPMGQPVDINQIVSAILGQNTASQKLT